jgi:hypothetical protein
MFSGIGASSGCLNGVNRLGGERNSGDFVPEASFTPDESDEPNRAVLIYDGSKVNGDRAIDLSGIEREGKQSR